MTYAEAMDERLLVIYDGDCRACRFGIEIVRRWDVRGELAFCPFGHPVAEARLAILPEDERYESFHASRGFDLHSATDAAREVLRVLPGGRVAAGLGLHNLYPLLARYRWIFGRLTPDRAATVTCG